jgi:hypothetical protein
VRIHVTHGSNLFQEVLGMAICFFIEIQTPSQKPVGHRRCRVALLLDFHVQLDRVDEVPTIFISLLYDYVHQLREPYLQRLVSTVDTIFVFLDTLNPFDNTTLDWLKPQIEATFVLVCLGTALPLRRPAPLTIMMARPPSPTRFPLLVSPQRSVSFAC